MNGFSLPESRASMMAAKDGLLAGSRLRHRLTMAHALSGHGDGLGGSSSSLRLERVCLKRCSISVAGSPLTWSISCTAVRH